MSLILDALRRRSAEQENPDPHVHTAREDSVLRTLGGPLKHGRFPGVKTLLLYGGSALAVGFVGVSALVFVAAPPASQPGARPAQSGSQALARTAQPLPQSVTVAAPLAAQPQSNTTPGEAAQSSGSGAGVQGAGARSSEADAGARSSGPEAGISRSPAPTDSRFEAQTASGLEPEDSAHPRTAGEPTAPRGSSGAPPPAARAGTLAPTGSSRQPAIEAPAMAAIRTVVKRSVGGPPGEDHFALALYYQRVGDFEGALAQYRLLLEQHDTSAEVHNNLGLLYEGHGQTDDAVKQFQRAITINPNYVRAHNNLGVTMLRTNQLDSAAAEFRMALAADPENVESVVNLALVERAAGRAGQARNLLQKALAIDPRSAGSHYNLAVLADESGDLPGAVEHYLAFLRLGSVDHPELIPQVRARLAALGS
ncbi:MAG TPA: tetratricopeptide repeat protein [Vicinamibacterales bacterium]|nr:tetratricopeptide repeat protein [Vicinamibacterales bacterium]